MTIIIRLLYGRMHIMRSTMVCRSIGVAAADTNANAVVADDVVDYNTSRLPVVYCIDCR